MINLILFSLAIGLSVYLFLKWATKNHDYFEKQGLKNLKPLPLFGSSSFLFTADHIGVFVKHYISFPDEKVVGFFDFERPAFFLRSPDVIKQLTVKDFSYFQDHVTFVDDESEDIFANILFNLRGKKWRDMRSSLSPMFTGRKMRVMLDLITKCSEQLCEYLREDYEKNGPTATQKTKTLFSKYSNDVIATCAFGVEVNSLKNPNNDIYNICQKVVGNGNFSFIQIVKFFILRFLPKIAKILEITFISKDIKMKFTELITHTMQVRKRENIQRPDMLQLLMKLKDGELSKEKEMDEIDPENKIINGEVMSNWTDDELIAQCFQFFLGGFHTTSSALSFCSYALAVNPHFQEKLIVEIDEANAGLNGKSLTYEVITKMKYMDMFISEVLRMWPALLISNRECKKSYTYEDKDGLKFSVQKGDALIIPIYTLHMDPKYFPDPQKFDPERFSDENRPNINMYAYLPFGGGPRNCIAFRFALMKMKAVMFHLLLNFRITVCKNTQIPAKIRFTTFGLVPKDDIELQFIPRDDKRTIS